jgi:D-3-phosphoglycerate dehydrogenase / 2-oxoglutarate reductase
VMIAKQLRNYLEHGSITNSVNFPTVDVAPGNSDVRLAIVNKNIPNMVAQISAKLASASLNILSLLNKSLGDIAYTLIDLNGGVSDDVLKQIAHIEGVVQLRKLQSVKR